MKWTNAGWIVDEYATKEDELDEQCVRNGWVTGTNGWMFLAAYGDKPREGGTTQDEFHEGSSRSIDGWNICKTLGDRMNEVQERLSSQRSSVGGNFFVELNWCTIDGWVTRTDGVSSFPELRRICCTINWTGLKFSWMERDLMGAMSTSWGRAEAHFHMPAKLEKSIGPCIHQRH